MDSNQGFESEDDWFRHEQWDHNVSWSCNGFNSHLPAIYSKRNEFETHFKEYHASVVASMDIEKLIEVSATPAHPVFVQCPFCDFDIDKENDSKRLERDSVSQNQLLKSPVCSPCICLTFRALERSICLPR